MLEYRIEKDSMGEIRVPADRRYGAQTQRSLENFRIGTEKMPEGVIEALCEIKKAAAVANLELGLLEKNIADAIIQAADEVLRGEFKDDFVLSVWQTGSGTQTNMNVNEVLAHRASEILGGVPVHPNDHVNKSQSSNDVFPSAMHLAAVKAIDALVTAVHLLEMTFTTKMLDFMKYVKTGRTHLQDATPITLGQEISGWLGMLSRDEKMLNQATSLLCEIALGGTAVGTGINAPKDFETLVCKEISDNIEDRISPASNKFQALTSKDELVFAHGAVKALAMDLLKIVNDVRWMASGPRCGLGEITIPENEPGSSIMPAKVNPTQCEAVSMVAAQVLGNDVTIGFAAGQGNFELNVYMPVLIYNFLQSCRLLTDAISSFNVNCAEGIKANLSQLELNASRSLMNVTALTPVIGYDKAALIAKKAHEEGLTLKEAALASGAISEENFDKHMDLLGMCFPREARP
ncbi:MAG: class II fumarate hydratase [Synergistaceae bacterium]|jgi:fumarate hydratase class II|nr:class II fumarate hydratase [Synergistaceae bacterium]